jgi:hypothetical protein
MSSAEDDLAVRLAGLPAEDSGDWLLALTSIATCRPSPSDRYRLRPDESGCDNLFLAGDWTDCGFNAGCIEAAVRSFLQAANAVLGRSRSFRIAATLLA